MAGRFALPAPATGLQWLAYPQTMEGSSVSNEQSAVVEAEFQQLTGALATLVKLREEIAGWSDVSSDDDGGGALDRVLAHIQALEAAYKSRKILLQEKLQNR